MSAIALVLKSEFAKPLDMTLRPRTLRQPASSASQTLTANDFVGHYLLTSLYVAPRPQS